MDQGLVKCHQLAAKLVDACAVLLVGVFGELYVIEDMEMLASGGNFGASDVSESSDIELVKVE